MAEGEDDVKFEINKYKEIITMDSLLKGYEENENRKKRKH